MMLTVASLPPVLALIANLNLAALIIVYDWRPRAHRIFLGLIAIFVVWNTAEIGLFNASTAFAAYGWSRVACTALAFLAGASLHLALVFPRPYGIADWKGLPIVLYSPGILYTILVWSSPLIIRGVSGRAWTPYYFDTGSWFILLGLQTVLFITLSMILYYHTWKHSRILGQQLQAKWMMVAPLTPLFIGTLTNLVLPHMADISVYPLGASLTALFSLVVSAAIIRFELKPLTPAVASEIVLDMLPIMVLQLNGSGRIVAMNPEAWDRLAHIRVPDSTQPVGDTISDVASVPLEPGYHAVCLHGAGSIEVTVDLHVHAVSDGKNGGVRYVAFGFPR